MHESDYQNKMLYPRSYFLLFKKPLQIRVLSISPEYLVPRLIFPSSNFTFSTQFGSSLAFGLLTSSFLRARTFTSERKSLMKMHHKSKKRGKENYHKTSRLSDEKDHELLQSSSHELTCGQMINYPKGKRSQRGIKKRMYCNYLKSLADAAVNELNEDVEYDDNDVYYENVKEIIDGCEMEATEGKTPCFSSGNTMQFSNDMLSEGVATSIEILLSFRGQCSWTNLLSALKPDSSIEQRDDISHSSLVEIENDAIKMRNATIMNGAPSIDTQERKTVNNTSNATHIGVIATEAQILENGNLSNGIKEIGYSEFDNHVPNNATEAIKATNKSEEDLEADCIAIPEFKSDLDKKTSNPIQFGVTATEAKVGENENEIKERENSEFHNNVLNNASKAIKAPNQSEEDLEADCIAIAELKCALDKMDLILEELKCLEKDITETENNNSPITDSDEFKVIYASVILELDNATKLASSALKNLRGRNKYFHHISSMVSEKFESLSQKDEDMVDRVAQEEGSPTSTSDRSELQLVPFIISRCLAAVLAIKSCAEEQFQTDVAAKQCGSKFNVEMYQLDCIEEIFNTAMESLKLNSSSNIANYEEIERFMSMIKTQILNSIMKKNQRSNERKEESKKKRKRKDDRKRRSDHQKG